MNFLYLVRHGQAGLRTDYDRLSPLGEQQSRLLTPVLKTDMPAIAGGLKRQQATAQLAGFADCGVDEGWSEFDLDAVYREVAPRIAESDPEFRAELDAMKKAVHDDHHPVHRKWTRGDIKVVRAWVEGTIPVKDTETFADFSARVRVALARALSIGQDVVVFSSATPIGLAVASCFDLGPREAMRMAGVLMNSSVTVLRSASELNLFSFNNVSHLPDPKLHTSR